MPARPPHRLLRLLCPSRLGVLLPLLLLPVGLQAKAPTVPLSELHQGKDHKLALGVVSHVLNRFHYRKFDLNDEMSRRILEAYIESLDQNRSYFTSQDIASFDRYQTSLDDLLKAVDLHPAFDIFRVYRQRVEQMSAYAVELLEQDFDFTVDEEFQFDRREVPWARNMQALKAVWRKRVKNDFLNLRLADKDPDETRDTLRKRYTYLGSSARQVNSDDIFQSYVNAYTTSIEPHTSYFSPRTSENFDINMRLSLEGIGAVLRARNDHTEIVRVIPGGPAARSGDLHAEDHIIGVAQGDSDAMTDVVGWRLDDVVDLIRGPKGTNLRLEVLSKRSGHAAPGNIIGLVRDEVKLEGQAAAASTIDLQNRKIGVINIPTFYIDFGARTRGEENYKSTSRDARRLINELNEQGIDGLIIDLRGNGGGSLAEALELTGLFIDQGPVVQTRDANGRVEVNQDPAPGVSYLGPLAVLVDRHSASASEIFAGAIQDYQRGIIVGEPTFGKGTVQNIIELNDFLKEPDKPYGRLKTTIAQFYRISGGSNQHKGVVPDILFPIGDDYSEHGERANENAIPWNEVEPADFIPADAPVASFAGARAKHERRIQEDELFQLFLQDLEASKTNSERTYISLLEVKRRGEKESLEKTRRELQNRMRALVGLPLLPEEEEEDEPAPDYDSEEAKAERLALDALLKETAYILDDLILPAQQARNATEGHFGEAGLSLSDQQKVQN